MAALPPKSSNFRGVTLFKPSGKWRAQASGGGGESVGRWRPARTMASTPSVAAPDSARCLRRAG